MTRLVAVLAVLVGLLGMHGPTVARAMTGPSVGVGATAAPVAEAGASTTVSHPVPGESGKTAGGSPYSATAMPCQPDPVGPGAMRVDCVTGTVLPPSAVALPVGTAFDGAAPGAGAAREWAASSASLDRSPDLIALSISRT